MEIIFYVDDKFLWSTGMDVCVVPSVGDDVRFDSGIVYTVTKRTFIYVKYGDDRVLIDLKPL